jgi:hypothetical protein
VLPHLQPVYPQAAFRVEHGGKTSFCRICLKMASAAFSMVSTSQCPPYRIKRGG